MNITVSTCYLSVDDPEKALWFYRDVLGLTVTADVGYENLRWVTVVAPAQPDLNVVLGPPNPDASPADREAIADLMAKGLYGWLLFATDNCDATFERIRADQHGRDPQPAARHLLRIEGPALAIGDDHDVARLRFCDHRIERAPDLGAAGRLVQLLDQRRHAAAGRRCR